MPLLPEKKVEPSLGWFPYALVSLGGAFLFCAFRLSLPSLGWERIAGLSLEAAILGWMLSHPFRSAGSLGPSRRAEACRWTALAVASLILTLPYARPERVGAGDAQDYAEHLADFIAQVRQGVFPVLVGQSRYAFNGAFNPLRTAPYFQYVGGALSALTFGALEAFALQNLEIILSLVGGAFGAYLCLLRLAPSRGWFCLLLAFLYISSPGILALTYSGDMIPSWLTLPYLPAFAYLIVRLADEGVSARRLGALAAVMAALWTIHAPIAMWLTFLAIPVIVVQLAVLARKSWRRCLLMALSAMGLFAALAGYEFVSVLALRLPGIPPHFATYTLSSVREVLDEGWKGFLRPVSPHASSLLTDLQLSPALWLCLALGLIACRKGGGSLRVLLLAACCLLVLLLPLPVVAGFAWHAMPAWVGRITDQWPMQRFFPILSALAPFAALLACARAWPRRPRLNAWIAAFLLVGAAWSSLEALKFLRRGFRVAALVAHSQQLTGGQSTVLSVYSYAMLGSLPRNFSYGPARLELQLHLLDLESLDIVGTNQEALLSGTVPQERRKLHFLPVPGGAILESDVRLGPGGTALLVFDFKGPAIPGTLVVSGQHLWREYPLPESSVWRDGGAGLNHDTLVGLHVPETAAPDSVAMRFVAAAGGAPRPVAADLTVIFYRSDDLPLRLDSEIPLRLKVHSPRPAWVETPRIFIPGYRALVAGAALAPERSPDGLVMIRVPAGESEIELDYAGTPWLRRSFWLSLSAWGLLLIAWPCRQRLWAAFRARRLA